MESPALVSSSLECGDRYAKSAELLPVSDKTTNPPANHSSLPTAYCSSSAESSIAPSISSPRTECRGEELSVHDAADLLCGLHLHEPENAQHCTDIIAEVNCLEHGEVGLCKSICNGAMATFESDPLRCCNSSKCADDALTSDESNTDINRDAVISLIQKDSETDKTDNDKIENGAMFSHLPSDGVDSTMKRCRHTSADSPSSARDYTAAGCDIVFSDGIEYRPYGCERHLHEIMELVSCDLSEPYSIYTYRYFIYNWPNLCFRVSVTILWT